LSAKAKFEYEWRDTPLHRMHVFPKISILVCLGGIVQIWMDPRYNLVALVAATILWYVAKVPRKWILIPLLWSIGGNWTLPFYTLPFLGYSYKVLPMDYATTKVLDLGYIPTVGYAIYTYGSLWWFAGRLLRFQAIFMVGLILYYVTSVPEVVQVLLKMRIPGSIIFVIMATFRFFPVFTRLSSDVVNSQKLRGWESSRNPINFVRSMVPLMTPISRQFMITVNMVTLSIANRAFGAYPKIPHKDIRMSTVDMVSTVLPIILFFLALYLAVTPPHYYGNL